MRYDNSVDIINSKLHPIFVGDGSLKKIADYLTNVSQVVVITDNNVWRHHEPMMLMVLNEVGFAEPFVISLSPGEANKSFTTVEQITDKCAAANLDRRVCFIAFGGGVIGDLTGFLAAIYKRGVKYIQIPTSLLAMVDSSIGGKTGVNTLRGKNLAGTVTFPEAVLIDPQFLSTLPDEEFKNGFGEMIKMAVVLDNKLFDKLEAVLPTNDIRKLLPLIMRVAELTAEVCDNDPLEKEYRKILNYGHTVGHALERASNYKLPHGVAVMQGMKVESLMAVNQRIMNSYDKKRQDKLINKVLGLVEQMSFSPEELLDIMKSDKKSSSGDIVIVQPVVIGKVRQDSQQFAWSVPEKITLEALSTHLQV
jgi:3-dehydroquinate synthase